MDLVGSAPETHLDAASAWEGLGLLDRVISLEAGSRCGSLRLEGKRLVAAAGGRALALGLWPRVEAQRRGPGGEWLPTERWADGFLAAWPRLEPGCAPRGDPFRALRSGRTPVPAEAPPGQDRADAFWPCSVYFSRIPAGVREAVGRYDDRRFHLLRLFAEDERLLELADSNPGLAFALACADPLGAAREGAAACPPGGLPEGLAGWKRRRIAAWLGFPETEAATRCLSVVEPRGLTLPLLRALRRRLGKAGAAFAFLRTIDPATLRILAEPRLAALASPRLLLELGAKPCGSCASCGRVCPAWMLGRVGGLARALGERGPRKPFASLAALERGHRELAERLEGRAWRRKALAPPRPLPEPPFPGDAALEPIRTEAGLFAEGLEMRNCLPRRLGEARAGRGAFYRVLSPFRGTLSVERSGADWQGPWVPGELKGPANAALPPEAAALCFERLFATGKKGAWPPGGKPGLRFRQAELPWQD